MTHGECSMGVPMPVTVTLLFAVPVCVCVCVCVCVARAHTPRRAACDGPTSQCLGNSHCIHVFEK